MALGSIELRPNANDHRGFAGTISDHPRTSSVFRPFRSPLKYRMPTPSSHMRKRDQTKAVGSSSGPMA